MMRYKEGPLCADEGEESQLMDEAISVKLTAYEP